ncbi:AbrB family transcriptional regulator [Paenibacillus alvei]|nr:AbrB family transcriptional regulator [Paenibacillus alvei]MCY9581284.1 AbrB family transcriptional regulator [Paenibacillus alvei]
MTIITATPLLLLNPLFGNMSGSTTHSLETSQQVATAAYTSEMLLKLILFAAISIACARIGTKIKLPTAYLLGPATGIALVQRFGVDGVPLPPSVIHMAQLLIGTYVGMTLKPGQMTNKLRTIGLAIASGLTLVVGALALSVLLAALQSVSESTALLSLAPGGMEQMGIIAHEIQADLSMVSGYQIFRTLFISFAVPPLLQFLFRIIAKKETGRHHHL